MRGLIAFTQGRVARWLGFILSGLALIAFLLVMRDALSLRDGGVALTAHGPALLGALLLYGATYGAMVHAWIVLARGCGASASGADLTRTFLISQIAKYLPGNVGQFIGRTWSGQALGISLKTLGTAMALEVAGVFLACAIFAGVALASDPTAPSLPTGAGAGMVRPIVIVIAMACALAGAAFILRRREDISSVLMPFVAAGGCYLMVFVLLAAANVLLVSDISGHWGWTASARIAGAFAVSWLVGFVTPGSPAGLGLRELTFFSMLAGIFPNETLVLAAALFRIATVSGDLMAWLVGIAMKPTPNAKRHAA